MKYTFVWLSRSPRFWPALLALMLLLVGCGSVSSALTSPKAVSISTLSDVRPISSSATTMYLGPVSRTQALLGIVFDGAQVRAYTCDGTPSHLATLAEWFAATQRARGSRAACSCTHATAVWINNVAPGEAVSCCRLAARVANRRCPPPLPAGKGGVPRTYSEASLLLIGLLHTLWRLSYQDMHDWRV